jgi:AhpD family alkylhydroperoxidase
MEARMKNPLFVVPGAMDVVQALGGVLHKAEVTGLDLELLYLRASQINGCAVCIDMHTTALRKAGLEEKVFAVAAWRESTQFTEAERAALALTEAATRIADRGDAVPDDVWDEAADQFSEADLAVITLGIASINFFNRINATTKQVAGV